MPPLGFRNADPPQPVDGACPCRFATQGGMRPQGLGDLLAPRITGFRLVDGSWKMMPIRPPLRTRRVALSGR